MRRSNRALWRFLALLCVACLMILYTLPFARAAPAKDVAAIVQEQLIPALEGDTQALLLFAAELNISNGPPDTRDYGERGMFGKLVDAQYVTDYYEDLEPRRDEVLAEVKRLLLGPWDNGGGTAFSFAQRREVKVLDYATGEWVKVDEVGTIRIEHTTEMTGKRRVAHVACGNQGYGIVRQ